MAELPDTLYCVVRTLKNSMIETCGLHSDPKIAQEIANEVKQADIRHILVDVSVWEMRRYKP